MDKAVSEYEEVSEYFTGLFFCPIFINLIY